MWQIVMHRLSDSAEMRLPDVQPWQQAMQQGIALCRSHVEWLFYLVKA